MYSFRTYEPLNMLHSPADLQEPVDILTDVRQHIALPAENEALGGVDIYTAGNYRPTRIDAADAIALAAIRMKEYYDKKHQPMFFNVGD